MTPRLRRLIEIMAAERCREHPELFDECVQEGMIAAWRTMGSHPDKPPSYHHASARRAINDVLRGRKPFGAESRRGSPDAHTTSESLWRTNSDGDDVLATEPAVEAPYAAVDVQDAVREAVAALPEEDRILVFGRFWEDLSYPEMAKILATRKNRLEWRWMTSIRPALEEALEPLVAA